jgi:hypothetical protein
LIREYHSLRAETTRLQSEARRAGDDVAREVALPVIEKAREWEVFLASTRTPHSTHLSLSQLDLALHAKWQSKTPQPPR